VLVACEESQAVTKAFRARGHEAFSCDIQPASGGHPEWHIQCDVVSELKKQWDIVIAFPPCTHLAVSGAKHFKEKVNDGRQQEGIDFFLLFTNLPHIKKVAIENPIGIMSRIYRKPDQIIHPYYFGDQFQKTTCLWLKGIPPLVHYEKEDLFNNKITHVGKGEFITTPSGKKLPKWYSDNKSGKARSKTFPGIANAMAQQWGSV